jgi:hypothetical protein
VTNKRCALPCDIVSLGIILSLIIVLA